MFDTFLRFEFISVHFCTFPLLQFFIRNYLISIGATFTVQPSLIVDMLGVQNAARGTAFFTMSLGFGFLLSVPFAGKSRNSTITISRFLFTDLISFCYLASDY